MSPPVKGVFFGGFVLVVESNACVVAEFELYCIGWLFSFVRGDGGVWARDRNASRVFILRGTCV